MQAPRSLSDLSSQLQIMAVRTIDSIRLDNLNALVREAGSLIAVADAAGTSSVYLSQIRSRAINQKTGKPREMGNKMARRLEEATGKPVGWMDEDHATADSTSLRVAEEAPAPYGKARADLKKLALDDVLRFAPQSERRRVLDDIRVQLVRARAKYSAHEFSRYLDAIDDLDDSDRERGQDDPPPPGAPTPDQHKR
jgi:hypothetical protein